MSLQFDQGPVTRECLPDSTLAVEEEGFFREIGVRSLSASIRTANDPLRTANAAGKPRLLQPDDKPIMQRSGSC